MPFPDIDGKSFEQDLGDVVDFITNQVTVPTYIQEAAIRLFKRVDIVSTRLYDDVQALKAWRMRLDPSYTPTDPQSQVTT